jgi:predicted  nucleic acid-binding Zn-ribbon protein
MDAPPFENLQRFFERIKNVGFFERLFFWKTIVSLGYDAFGEYQQTRKLLQEQGNQITELTAKNRELSLNVGHQSQQLIQLQQDLVGLAAKNEDLIRKMNERENEAGALIAADKKNQQIISQLKADMAGWTARYDQVNVQFTDAQKSIAEYRQKEEGRLSDHEQRVAGLNVLQKQLEEKLRHIAQEREDEIHSQYTEMEKTWLNHEKLVEETLRNICRQHNIEYCDKEKFPYSGKPDNSVIICSQYVIFDAKSPKDSENLDNFPAYIKSQAQNVKKYVKGDDIKRDVFLVVPTNAITSLPEVVYRIGEVRVYVVTYDSMEPIILALKKIEEYSFVEQLSPEDRENICQVIGKFVHASKRKIQIDTYFSKLFIELLENCDSSLPQNIRDKLDEIEKSEIMNPPAEQRNKMTPLPGLVKSVKVLEKEAEAREIDMTAVTKDKVEKITLLKFLE